MYRSGCVDFIKNHRKEVRPSPRTAANRLVTPENSPTRPAGTRRGAPPVAQVGVLPGQATPPRSADTSRARHAPSPPHPQEDLTPKEFCQEIHACPHEMRGLEHQMQDVQRKHAWESAEEREAAVSASRADPTRVIGGKDAADSAVVEDDDEALEL